MKKIILCICGIVSLSTLLAQNDFQLSKNNLEYKLVAGNIAGAAMPKNGDMAAFSVVQKMGDSLVFNSYEAGHQMMQIDTVVQPMDIKAVLSLMHVGDSALVRINAYTLFLEEKQKAQQNPNYNEESFTRNVPAFFQKEGNYIFIGMRLLDKFTTDSTSAEFAKDAARQKVCSSDQSIKQAAFQEKMQKKMQEEMAAKAGAAKATGAKFLAANKTKPGVITTKSGLQYKILKLGKGPKATLNDKVSCHYAGSLLNGAEFDNSYKRGQPYETNLTNVIKGWTEVLQLVPEGSKFQIWAHSDIAYGDYGNGPSIGPGEVLFFDMELVKVFKTKTAPAPASKPVRPTPNRKPVKQPVKKKN
jgi:FKBP-type peptidyl-prolyl cis-trans isomerase